MRIVDIFDTKETKERIMTDLIKVSDVLKELPISRATLIRLLQKGKIRGVKIGKKWFVYSSEVERVKNKGTEEGG